jgi:hypothetical protein
MAEAPQAPETFEQMVNRLSAGASADPSVSQARPLSPAAQAVIANAPPREVGTWEHIQKAAWPSVVQNTAGALQMLSYIGAPELQYDPALQNAIPNAASAMFPKEMAYKPEGEVERAANFMFDPSIALSPGRSVLTKLAEGAIGNAGAYVGDRLARESGHEGLRLPAAILGGVGASNVRQLGTDQVGRMLTPKAVQGMPPMTPAQLESLRMAGISPPMVGQEFNNRELLLREASTAAGANGPTQQRADFSKFAMGLTGSKEPFATIEARLATADDLGEDFKWFAMRSSGQVPALARGKRVSAYLNDATQHIKSVYGSVPDYLKNINKQLLGSMKNGTPIDGQTLQQWRSQLSKWRMSQSPLLADMGSQVLPIIDDIIWQNLPSAAEREALDVTKAKWSTLMDIHDSMPIGVEGARGIIDPASLASTINSKKGMPSQKLPLAKTADAMVAMPDMPNVPRSKWGPVTNTAAALGNVAGLASFIPQLGNLAAQHLNIGNHWPPIAGAIASGVTGANWLRHRLSSTAMKPNMQEMYRNALTKTPGMVRPMERIIGAASQPMQVDDRQNRKTGGRVSTHDMEADQLVRAAERAKKGWNDATEPLLNQSDDAVAHALEVANRSI